LRVASPATVSRCGMVYIEPIHLGWEPLIDTWKENMVDIIQANHLENIVKNVKKIFSKMLPVLREECKEAVESVNANIVQSCLNLIQSFLNPQRLDLKKT
jgi:dynein heavy chain